MKKIINGVFLSFVLFFVLSTLPVTRLTASVTNREKYLKDIEQYSKVITVNTKNVSKNVNEYNKLTANGKKIIDNHIKSLNAGLKSDEYFIYENSKGKNLVAIKENITMELFDFDPKIPNTRDPNKFLNSSPSYTKVSGLFPEEKDKYAHWFSTPSHVRAYGYFFLSKTAVEDVFWAIQKALDLAQIGTAFASAIVAFILTISGVGIAALPYVALALASTTATIQFSKWILDVIQREKFRNCAVRIYVIHTDENGNKLPAPKFYPYTIPLG